MPDEPVAPQPTAAEIEAKLRAEFDAKLAAEAKAHADTRAAWQAEQQQIAQYLRAEQERQARANQPPPEDDDEEAVVSRKELKRALEQASQQTNSMTAEQQLVWARGQRQTNRQIAVQTLPEFAKYADEIDAMLDKLAESNPLGAANPNAYREIHKIVVGQHLYDDRLRAEAERAAKVAAGDAETDDDTSAPAAEPRRTSTMPVGDGAPDSRRISTKKKPPPLTAEDEFAVTHFFKGNEERFRTFQRGEIPDEYIDFLGLNTRKRAS